MARFANLILNYLKIKIIKFRTYVLVHMPPAAKGGGVVHFGRLIKLKRPRRRVHLATGRFRLLAVVLAGRLIIIIKLI